MIRKNVLYVSKQQSGSVGYNINYYIVTKFILHNCNIIQEIRIVAFIQSTTNKTMSDDIRGRGFIFLYYWLT